MKVMRAKMWGSRTALADGHTIFIKAKWRSNDGCTLAPKNSVTHSVSDQMRNMVRLIGSLQSESRNPQL